MKTLLLLIALTGCAYGQTALLKAEDAYGTLSKVEPLSRAELDSIKAAKDQINKDQRKLIDLENSIAKAHSFKAEDWMEWQTWVVIDGQFIELRYHDSMGIKP